MKRKFTPPDYFLVFIILQILIHYTFPIIKLIRSPFTYLGIPLIIIGVYVNLVLVYTIFKKANTTIKPYEKPSKLVMYGPFKFTRNPTYLGMALTLLGIAILLGSLITFIFPVIFIILTDIFTIPIEEKNLEEKFGKKYLEYKKKVRRWI